MNPDLSTAAVYTDLQGLASLKLAAKEQSPQAIKAVAKQFEALFVQMMLKSMREASSGDPLLDDSQTNMYRDMYDKQLALDISEKGRGIGLADMLVKQLQAAQGRTQSSDAAAAPAPRVLGSAPVSPRPSAATTAKSAAPSANEITASPAAFVRGLWPLAEKAAAKLGTTPETLIAQAALETGWGKSVIRHPDGHTSHNLFNIKADNRWNGASVAKQTLEYRQGVASRERAQFRSYGSYAESFNDYVNFLQAHPRYAEALHQVDDPQKFLQSLQEAGYATDPNYASKISEIMNRNVIADARANLKSFDQGTLT